VKSLPANDRRLRVMAIATHPVQYAAPQFRRMASSSDIDFQVVYCNLRGAAPSFDPDFDTTVEWDIPLLDGYSWTALSSSGSSSSPISGHRELDLWDLIRKGNFDAILCYVGYLRKHFWIAYFAAKLSKTAFLFGTDAIALTPRDGRPWKVIFKKLAWPLLFNLADQVIVPSSGTRELMRTLRVPEERITLTPYTVDNDRWMKQAAQIDRDTVRASWNASAKDAVVLFCAKLQPWKRPQDALRAFAKCNVSNARLIFAGDGPLRDSLQSEAFSLQIADQIRFLGFVNQSELPAIYKAADVLVVPSEYEPFAVVVNEAMCCGCPAIVSDHVGAARDLVLPVHPQFVFPSGNIDALAEVLGTILNDRSLRTALKDKCITHMHSWSFDQNVPATIEAIQRAVARRRLRI
jgi:glycosyltransferase involved in cell wall biosynthesis